MVGAELFDQFEQDAGLVFLGDRLVVMVVRLRLAGIGLVVKHHIELGTQVFDRLREGCGGGE